jgi:protein TonB
MKNVIKLVAMFVLITGTAMSQTTPKPDAKQDANGVYQTAEVMPSYPGGNDALMKYLSTNLKYPENAKSSKIQGKVFVSFVVNSDGKVSNVKVLRGISGGCDEEAVRVVQAMPNWIPGKQKGNNVPVQFNLPIQFKLDNYPAPMK